MSLEAIAVHPQNQPAKGILVILHGWGANAQDVAALADFLQLPDYYLFFPNAPFPHPYSSEGRAWYSLPDTFNFRSSSNFQNQPELQASRQQLTDWLLSLEGKTGIPLDRTVLSGFSQGGAMTLDVGLKLPLAGLMVLSGYLHAPIAFPPGQPPRFPSVLMVHGRQDLVVPLLAAQQARDSLTALGVPLRYQELTMGHEIQPVVLGLMQSFMEETL